MRSWASIASQSHTWLCARLWKRRFDSPRSFLTDPILDARVLAMVEVERRDLVAVLVGEEDREPVAVIVGERPLVAFLELRAAGISREPAARMSDRAGR